MVHDHSRGSVQEEQTQGQLAMPDKLLKMVQFWVHHNEEHARSYRDWAGRAQEMGLEEVGVILEKLAGEALRPNVELERLLLILKHSQPRIDSPRSV